MTLATTTSRRLVLLALCVCAVALAFAHPPAAGAASTAQIVKLLNAQRAANGIPAGVTENPVWNVACQLHNAYEHRYNELSHSETEGKPGYSSAGNLIAETSVLAQGLEWNPASPPGDPYDNAPFHLFDLLNPRISSTGAADSEGFGCVEIELGTLRAAPAAVTAYSYPGNHRRDVPVSQRASEMPETPAQAVGFGKKTTGPNLFVYFDGPWANGSRALVSSATMSSSHGSVALRWVDNSSSNLLPSDGRDPRAGDPAGGRGRPTGFRSAARSPASCPGRASNRRSPPASRKPGAPSAAGSRPAPRASRISRRSSPSAGSAAAGTWPRTSRSRRPGARTSTEPMATPAIRWALGPADVDAAIALREEVFVREQNVPVEEELDGRDEEALHLVALRRRVARSARCGCCSTARR